MVWVIIWAPLVQHGCFKRSIRRMQDRAKPQILNPQSRPYVRCPILHVQVEGIEIRSNLSGSRLSAAFFSSALGCTLWTLDPATFCF